MPERRALSQPLRSFVEELVLCAAANGGRGPALLWPEDPMALPALLELPRPARPAPDADATVPGGPGAEELAAELGRRLQLRVRPYFRFLFPDSPVVEGAPGGAESAFTVLEGACRCVLARVGEDPAPGPSHPLGMRLRSGGTLFVPQAHTYRLSEIHVPTTLLRLDLEAPG
ncbi:hypothetical protein [Streptomyces sp. NPDC058735]|uniref:hypothetical protein n=1 Tax=unclassified Streptomyces TaxID=2593676 RepID=UPI0036AC9AEC